MNDFLNYYDWPLTSQLILLIGVCIYMLFYKKLKEFSETIVSIPFSLCLGISIFTSPNLISFIFFSEVIFNLSNILYKNKYKQYKYKHFENVRYFFWIILLYCYYQAFSTFSLNSVPKGGSIELIFVCVLLMSIIFIQLLGFILRRENEEITIIEIIGYEIFTVLIFSLKSIHIVSSLTDFLEPKHHYIVDVLILAYIIIGGLLSLRFLRTKNVQKINSVIRSLVILSLLPLVSFSENIFWGNFSTYSVLLILSFLAFEVVGKFMKYGKLKGLVTFILLLLITGLNPFGYFRYVFKGISDNDSQTFLLLGASMCVISLALNSRRLFELSMKVGKA